MLGVPGRCRYRDEGRSRCLRLMNGTKQNGLIIDDYGYDITRVNTVFSIIRYTYIPITGITGVKDFQLYTVL